jgi:hypothetical protein
MNETIKTNLQHAKRKAGEETNTVSH